MEHLSGKVAVVTGAASGIGRACALAFAEHGMRVVLSDLRADALETTVAEFRTAGHEVFGIAADASDYSAVIALRDGAIARFGAVHVVHCNAGVVGSGMIEDLDTPNWEWVINVDMWSVIHGVRAFLPALKSQNDGHLVATASAAGLLGYARIAPYVAAKHAVVGTMSALREELRVAKSAVGCSVLCPEQVATPLGATSEQTRPASVPVAPLAGPRPGDSLQQQGISTESVAALVVRAVREQRFWILTHPTTLPQAQARVTEMAADNDQ